MKQRVSGAGAEISQKISQKTNQNFGQRIGLVQVLLSLVCVSAGAATTTTGKVFEPGSDKQKLLFNFKQEAEQKGDRRVLTNTFTDPGGAVAVVETIEHQKEGDKERFAVYKVSQKQLGAEGTVELKNGEAHFTYVKDGKTKTGSEKAGEDFVVGPMVPSRISENWEKLMKGEKLKVRLGVPDRLETVGFEIKKLSDETLDGQKAVNLQMKPSSFIIAALVKPLNFHMSADGKKLLQLDGRTQPKLKDGSKWKDLDAVTVYTPAP